jgi:hypothetical protein
MKEVTGYETLQFDCRVTAGVRDVWGMAEGTGKIKTRKQNLSIKFKERKFNVDEINK